MPRKKEKKVRIKKVDVTEDKVSINFRVSNEMREQLKEEAWKRRKSVNEYLLEIVRKREGGSTLISYPTS